MNDKTIKIKQNNQITIFNAKTSLIKYTPTLTPKEKVITTLRKVISPFDGYVLIVPLLFIDYYALLRMTDSLFASVMDEVTTAVESSFEDNTNSYSPDKLTVAPLTAWINK